VSRDFLIGLDLGSHAFRMLAARRGSDAPEGVEIVAAATVPAAGIRRGMIVAIDDAARAVSSLRGELERRLGTAVGGAYVGIGGPHVGSVPSRGLVVVSRSDNRIGPDDIRRVLEAAGAISLGRNTEVLTVVPREYIVDGERNIKEAEGMQGTRLEVEAVVLTSATPHVKNIRQVLAQSDLDDHDLIVSPLATARAVLTPRQRELGVALVDIGHGTTDVAVFEDGQLLATTILPIGGAHITNDIAIGLRCAIDAAEIAKHEYGAANAGTIGKRESVELSVIDPLQDGTSFSRRELAEIIDARLEEIFELVGQELKRIGRWRLLPGGVVLSGGTANIPGIVETARQAFHLPVQLGYPNAVSGPKDVAANFSYATALGIVFAVADASGAARRGPHLSFPKLPGARFSGGGVGKFFRSLLP